MFWKVQQLYTEWLLCLIFRCYMASQGRNVTLHFLLHDTCVYPPRLVVAWLHSNSFKFILPQDYLDRGGALQYQMDIDVRLTLPKAGAFGENTVSKNEGSLGEKPIFGSKLGGIG